MREPRHCFPLAKRKPASSQWGWANPGRTGWVRCSALPCLALPCVGQRVNSLVAGQMGLSAPPGEEGPRWQKHHLPPLAALTDRIRSPRRSSPLRSAGPPARMKETKMPSPSSPPTMLKPRPLEPLCREIFRGSLVGGREGQPSGLGGTEAAGA